PTSHQDDIESARDVEGMSALNVHTRTRWYGVTRAGGVHLVLPSTSGECLSDLSTTALIQDDRRGCTRRNEPHPPVAGLPPSLIPKSQPKHDPVPIVLDERQDILFRLTRDERQIEPQSWAAQQFPDPTKGVDKPIKHAATLLA